MSLNSRDQHKFPVVIFCQKGIILSQDEQSCARMTRTGQLVLVLSS